MIDALYTQLLSNARNIDPVIYKEFFQAVMNDFEEKLSHVPSDEHKSIYPMNYQSRLEYIKSRPSQYHSVVQLKALHEEFTKRLVSFQVKHKKKLLD